jgi:hypothetical protein
VDEEDFGRARPLAIHEDAGALLGQWSGFLGSRLAVRAPIVAQIDNVDSGECELAHSRIPVRFASRERSSVAPGTFARVRGRFHAGWILESRLKSHRLPEPRRAARLPSA